MASPTCTVNSASTAYGTRVNFNTSATIQLADTTGVTTWSLTVVGTDELTTSSDYTLAITDEWLKTATIVTPSKQVAYSVRLQSMINGGLNNGVFDPNYITTFVIYNTATYNSSNLTTLRLLTNGETLETHPTHGYVKAINDLIRSQIVGNSFYTYAVTAHVNDLLSNSNNILLNPNGSWNITGMLPFSAASSNNIDVTGCVTRTLININATNTATIVNQSGSSTYKFKTNTGSDIALGPGEILQAWYSASNLTWYCKK